MKRLTAVFLTVLLTVVSSCNSSFLIDVKAAEASVEMEEAVEGKQVEEETPMPESELEKNEIAVEDLGNDELPVIESENMESNREELESTEIDSLSQEIPEDQRLSDYITYVNPIYDGIAEVPEQPEDSGAEENDISDYGLTLFASTEYFENISDAAMVIRTAMVKRTDASLQYMTTDSDYSSLIKNVFEKALDETANSYEGDYLRWVVGSYGCSLGGYYQTNSAGVRVYYYTLSYRFTYYTTAEQEAEVTKRVSSILGGFNFTTKTTDYEKIKAIYDYVCSHVTYDYTNADTYMLKYTAYAALINGTAVCQGYSTLLYRMLREEGISTRLIAGLTNQGVRHGWNIIRIGVLYYNVDSTWDAGRVTKSYFLKGSATFGGHTRNSEYTTTEFNSKYPTAATDYNPNAEPDETINGLAKDENGSIYYYANGIINTAYTGFAVYEGAYYYVTGGRIAADKSGFVSYGTDSMGNSAKFFVVKGKLSFKLSGLVADPYSSDWYFLADGQVQTQYTGLALYDGEWFYVENGKLKTAFSGLQLYDGARFLVAEGHVLTGYSGLFAYEGKWYYIAAGQVCDYTGLAFYDNVWFYVQNGILAENYTGRVQYNGAWFTVVNGMIR